MNQISIKQTTDTIGCTNSSQRAINDVVASSYMGKRVYISHTHTHTLLSRIHLHCRNETTMQIQYLRRDGMIMPK